MAKVSFNTHPSTRQAQSCNVPPAQGKGRLVY
jgi:hypothetical protein